METVHVRGVMHLFLLFVFSIIFMWIGISYVSQNIQYSSAQKFFSYAVMEIENGYFSDEVLDKCKKEAEKNGYELTVTRYGTGEHRDAKVRLDFSYTFPIIQKVQKYSIEGYAR